MELHYNLDLDIVYFDFPEPVYGAQPAISDRLVTIKKYVICGRSRPQFMTKGWSDKHDLGIVGKLAVNFKLPICGVRAVISGHLVTVEKCKLG